LNCGGRGIKMAEKKYNIVLEGGYLRIYQNSILSAYVPKKKHNNPMAHMFIFFNYQFLKYPNFKCLKKKVFRIYELYSQMGLFSNEKRSVYFGN
jgi:hypothetical protein